MDALENYDDRMYSKISKKKVVLTVWEKVHFNL
jgi:hypothetical protein